MEKKPKQTGFHKYRLNFRKKAYDSNVNVGKSAHTANTSKGMGDYYGTGIKAKIGEVREDTVGYKKVSKKGLKTPPKTMA